MSHPMIDPEGADLRARLLSLPPWLRLLLANQPGPGWWIHGDPRLVSPLHDKPPGYPPTFLRGIQEGNAWCPVSETAWLEAAISGCPDNWEWEMQNAPGCYPGGRFAIVIRDGALSDAFTAEGPVSGFEVALKALEWRAQNETHGEALS